MVMREVDENLAIFLGLRNVEKERNDHLLVEESHHFDDELNCAETCLVGADDSFLNLEMEMRDHDWLLKQPDAPLPPPLDADAEVSATSQTKCSNGGDEAPLKSVLDVSESSSALVSVECCRRPSPSARRSATPTARNPAKSRPSRASTPTSRASLLPSSKSASAAQARSSTPVRPTSRSSTPASRPSLPVVSKSGTRSATPTRKPAPPPALDRSLSGKKTGAPVLKSSVIPSRGASPAVKSREADQNPKKVTSMPKRPASASRGRLSSSASNEKPRQKSCSPARARVKSRGYNDDVNPVVMGTKMVDRVVNMRKLAPPKQDEHVSQENPRKSSQEGSGFGRSLSKKSLEMAIRHMEIRRSVPNRSSQSGCAKISTAAGPESPQTSNTDSSKSSSCRSSYFLNGAEMDE